jgi:signal transduction histidine kinase
MTQTLQADVDAVARIAAVPTILDVVCRITGMRFAAVARVTEDRWICCEVKDGMGFGLRPGGELNIETTICNEIRKSRVPVIIGHADDDPIFCQHPTPKLFGYQSYISMPIILADGQFFGTLCAMDPRPARLNKPEIIGMLTLFAELIGFHLDAGDKLSASEANLREAREAGELREQFIAVLGHDLRNPLMSIDACMRLLQHHGLEERSACLVAMARGSVARMEALINDVLDFARGRLGGGLTLNARPAELRPVLEQVAFELGAAWPERKLEARYDITRPVLCDKHRIGQLYSNLLGNAFVHGAPDQPVRVRASTADGFELAVVNGGPPIPEAAMRRLFQPFFRGEVRNSQQGLGLGLYIAAEIARAHCGRLDVASNPTETRFTFTMP